MQKLARELSKKGTIGVVPTMGYLHEGHLSLVRRARKAADFVIATIFVNPTQFAPSEDLAGYPRDEKGDIRKIAAAAGDIVFIPKRDDMYPSDFETFVTVEKITQTLEGKARPTHFRGVTTIVSKLFNIVRPDIAVFGQKDYQQAVVIKRMVSDLDFPIKIIVAPTVREKDGLAMSSRNKYFSSATRPEAVCLYKALTEAKRLVRKDGVSSPSKVKRRMVNVITSICKTAVIDYIEFTDYSSLAPVRNIGKSTICSLAVRLHGVRLIDNMRM